MIIIQCQYRESIGSFNSYKKYEQQRLANIQNQQYSLVYIQMRTTQQTDWSCLSQSSVPTLERQSAAEFWMMSFGSQDPRFWMINAKVQINLFFD